MFTWYKRYKKKRIEKEMNKCIEYNQKTINLCKRYNEDIFTKIMGDRIMGYPIATTYMKENYEALTKYNVNKNIYKLMLQTNQQAINLYDKCYNVYCNIRAKEKLNSRQEQISMYKEAFKQVLMEIHQERGNK